MVRISTVSFSYESSCWESGFSYVIGVDEVGRGAFAGPVVAAAAALHQLPTTTHRLLPTIVNLGINDSKQLSPKRREELVPHIKQHFHCGIGEASVAEINRYGIVSATHRAMRRAIRQTTNHVVGAIHESPLRNEYYNNQVFLLVDGNVCPRVSGFSKKNSQAIIKGDGKSISIAAASIIAKVYRDALMVQLAKKYPMYGWEKNKGYGTLHHRTEINRHGSCPTHRTAFLSSTVQSTV